MSVVAQNTINVKSVNCAIQEEEVQCGGSDFVGKDLKSEANTIEIVFAKHNKTFFLKHVHLMQAQWSINLHVSISRITYRTVRNM